jgi:hypothetical protein
MQMQIMGNANAQLAPLNQFEHVKNLLADFHREFGPNGDQGYSREASHDRNYHHPDIAALRSISSAVAYRMERERRKREAMRRYWAARFDRVPAAIKLALGIGDEPPGL